MDFVAVDGLRVRQDTLTLLPFIFLKPSFYDSFS